MSRQIEVAVTRQTTFGSVNAMDKKAIGARIRQARLACGISTQEQLASLLRGKSDEKGKPLTRQAVQAWESGDAIPSWGRITRLAAIFRERGKPEYGEEWIMFGTRREAQLAHDRPLLAYVNQDEAQLLTEYRKSNGTGRNMILKHAISVAQDLPAEEARVVALSPNPRQHRQRKE